MPSYARSVVDSLKWKLEIFVGFEFDDGEASVVGFGEDVDHRAIGGGEGWNLRVDELGTQASVEGSDVIEDERFEPAFGMHAPERVIFWAVLVADYSGKAYQVAELFFVFGSEDALFGSNTERDFFMTVKIW